MTKEYEQAISLLDNIIRNELLLTDCCGCGCCCSYSEHLIAQNIEEEIIAFLAEVRERELKK